MRENTNTHSLIVTKVQRHERLTLVFVQLVLGQVLQQVFIDGEWTAGCHFLDGIDTEGIKRLK